MQQDLQVPTFNKTGEVKALNTELKGKKHFSLSKLFYLKR